MISPSSYSWMRQNRFWSQSPTLWMQLGQLQSHMTKNWRIKFLSERKSFLVLLSTTFSIDFSQTKLVFLYIFIPSWNIVDDPRSSPEFCMLTVPFQGTLPLIGRAYADCRDLAADLIHPWGSKPQNNITYITISSSRSLSDHGFSQRDVYLSSHVNPRRYHYFGVISMTDRAKIPSDSSWTSHSSRWFHLWMDHRSFKLIVSHHQTVTSVSNF